MRISLNELIGENCESLDDGNKIYRLIFSEIKEGRIVEIDFSNIKVLLTPCLNAAFGKLFDFFEKDRIMRSLDFRNISAEHLKKMNEFIDYVGRMDADKSAREFLQDLHDEDSLQDDGLM